MPGERDVILSAVVPCPGLHFAVATVPQVSFVLSACFRYVVSSPVSPAGLECAE